MRKQRVFTPAPTARPTPRTRRPAGPDDHGSSASRRILDWSTTLRRIRAGKEEKKQGQCIDPHRSETSVCTEQQAETVGRVNPGDDRE